LSIRSRIISHSIELAAAIEPHKSAMPQSKT
jgi:hypothetical protein